MEPSKQYVVPASDTERIRTLMRRFSTAESVDRIAIREDLLEIHATFGSLSSVCPSCGGPLTLHGWSKAKYLDAPADGRVVQIHARRPRFLCRNCKKTLTPIVPGLVEGPKLTDGLVSHIQQNLWGAISLRALAVSVGALPKTISEVLLNLADDARARVASPTELGIHELWVGKNRHLVLTNLSTGTTVDFLPDGEDQMESLSGQLMQFESEATVQYVAVEADREIVRTVASRCTSSRIVISLSTLQTLVAQVIANLGRLEARRGRPGSISYNEAKRLAGIRQLELCEEDRGRLEEGRREHNMYWALFDAKEQLLNKLEDADCADWLEVVRAWIHNLPSSWQPSFHRMLMLLSDLKSQGATISVKRVQPHLDQNIRTLQGLLSKPGRSFSSEMIAALILAAPAMSVPLRLMTGRKGLGPLWLEETWDAKDAREPSTAGVSLGSLVTSLSVHWGALQPTAKAGPTPAPTITRQ